MPWHRESSALLRVDPTALWTVVSDLSQWPRWCAGLAEAHVGSDASLVDLVPVGPVGAVHRRTAPPARVVVSVVPRRLVVEQPQPGGVCRVSWDLEPQDDGLVRFRQRVEVTGPLTVAAVRGLGLPLSRTFHDDVVRLHGLLAGQGGAPPAEDALTLVIAGGSGSLGRRLGSDLLCRGHDVVVLTRRVDPDLPLRQAKWDGRTVGPWVDVLHAPRRTAVVNLAGRLVDARPTPANIASLRDSRVLSTLALVEASRRLPTPLASWVQASTTAIYGDAGEQRCDETTPLPTDRGQALPQMTGVARPWEEAFAGAHTDHGVILRTSLVLDRGAPVMQRLVDLTRVGLGGPIGDGRQWVSWIHIDDWLALARAALGLDPDLRVPSGVVIAASDHPVRNAELMATLGRRLHRPWAPPTPAVLARIGAVVLRTDPALALTGRHTTSAVLRGLGHTYRFPRLDEALADLLG